MREEMDERCGDDNAGAKLLQYQEDHRMSGQPRETSGDNRSKDTDTASDENGEEKANAERDVVGAIGAVASGLFLAGTMSGSLVRK
jgi:hypothetical protein